MPATWESITQNWIRVKPAVDEQSATARMQHKQFRHVVEPCLALPIAGSTKFSQR